KYFTTCYSGWKQCCILVDPVSPCGNLLLHIGPKADGTIPVIMEQVTAAANGVDQDENQLTPGVINAEVFGAIVAVAHAHAAVLFPGMVDPVHARGVFGRPVAAVLVAGCAAPRTVDHLFLFVRGLIYKPSRD